MKIEQVGQPIMVFDYDNKIKAGTFLAVAGAQFIILTIFAEALYPNFSVPNSYISDLGIWNYISAPIFNSSMVLYGLLLLISSYFIQQEFRLRLLSSMFVLGGLGAIFAGVFPFDSFVMNGFPVIHNTGAIVAFISGGLAPIISYKVTKKPFRYFSVILGVIVLIALTLFMVTPSYSYLGLGVGGMESLIFYPGLIWDVAFGCYLMASSD